jgi:hypothetical protein
MAQGLIAAALGGFGKALSTVGEMEAKKQNEASLRKELMAAESDERLRIDEITRKRDIEGIGAKTEATARANLAAAPIVGRTGVATEEAKYEAESKGNLPQLRAESEAGGEVAKLDARKKLELDEKQADADADKRAAELKAQTAKGIAKLEAEAEKEKYKAMVDAGVPKAKADALMAEYTAGDAQRKKQASDAIDAEIEKVKKLAANPGYIAGKKKLSVADSAGNIAEIREREAGYRSRPDKGSDGRTTITELKTKLTVAEDRLATELQVPRAKINEAIGVLKKKADRGGDAAAAKKLRDIQSYRDEVDRAQENISRWKDTGSDKDSTSGSGNKPSIESFNK